MSTCLAITAEIRSLHYNDARKASHVLNIRGESFRLREKR